MTQVDLSYFERRAEQELARAQAASVPSAARAHYELSKLLLERVALLRSEPPRQAQG